MHPYNYVVSDPPRKINNEKKKRSLDETLLDWFLCAGTVVVKEGLAQMLKGGIIMDVVNAEQARIAEEAGACAVMALEKVPADIRKDGGVARMADPKVGGASSWCC